MATYLVTGVAGFIASKVAAQLLAAGHTVVGVDNLNDYYDVRLKDYRLSQLLGAKGRPLGDDPKKSIYSETSPSAALSSGNFIFHHIDIESLPALDALFGAHKFDAVFNLAARAGVRYSLANPYVYLSTNTLGTLNLLESQRKHGVKKQILASTSSLYAGCPMPFTEDQPVNTPLSPYAAAKKGAELMAYSYHKLYGLDISVLRYFTVFGPAGRPDMAPFRFIKWIDEGTPITLYGDGTQARDFTYIDDIARGTILACKPLGYEVINLGGGNNPITLHTMIGWIEAQLGARGRMSKDGGPLKAKIAEHPVSLADMAATWADIAKAKRILGWSPQVSPEEGFQRTVSWHIENQQWLKLIRV
jgi:UDP-glucuronate 4-epimerase